MNCPNPNLEKNVHLFNPIKSSWSTKNTKDTNKIESNIAF